MNRRAGPDPGRGRLSGNAAGALWIILGSVFFALNDAVVKEVGQAFDPVQMALFRYVVGLLILLPWLVKAGGTAWRSGRIGLHLGRAVIAGTGQAAVYYSVIHLYLADATAAAFTRPLFLTLLAVVMLGEAVGWRRWAATAFGFLGVLVMVRPGGAVFDVAWAVALVAAVLFALGIILIRRMSTTEPVIRILFYYHVFGIVLFIGPALWVWRTPDPASFAMLTLIGALTAAAMACFVKGFSLGEASVVGPLEYTRLIYASLIGYFLFAETPSGWTLLGAAMIAAGALYSAGRPSRQAGRSRAQDPRRAG